MGKNATLGIRDWLGTRVKEKRRTSFPCRDSKHKPTDV